MVKLFAVMLGGRAAGCNIELHDVVFVAGESLEETYPLLVNKWFGSPLRLHIDSTVELTIVDGYEISLTKEKPENGSENTLYFVNFGGYKPNFFGELHEMKFYVASEKVAVTAKAKKDLCVSLFQQHLDDSIPIDSLCNENQVDIDAIIPIRQVDQYYVQLKPTTATATLVIESSYRKLNLSHILEKAQALKEQQLN